MTVAPQCEFVFVYVTASSQAEAERLAQAAVTARLAACGNILPQIRAVYRWEGEVQSAAECLLILKTTAEVFAKLDVFLRERHSYKTPCIVALPLVEVTADYADWIRAQVAPCVSEG